MRKVHILAIATAATILVWMATPRDTHAQACTLGSFRGEYTFANQGVSIQNGTVGFGALAGRFVADGAGHLTASLTESNDGLASRRTGTGTYTVNADCSGTMMYTDSLTQNTGHYDIFIGTSQVQFVETDDGVVTAGTAYRQIGFSR